MDEFTRNLRDMDFFRYKNVKFIVFRRVPKELTEGSVVGGIITIFTAAFMSLLILFEFNEYMTIQSIIIA